ncbi:MAG: 50S ribosomal protein L17 [Chloroflexi bacterium]|nr:50S ribosomal protein L17 [Chloroflexota bacterium]|tara:strand:- start:4406 stop:4744 length:339 start_codon:yes stop_codon:yes gene_type:complete
MGGKKLGRPTAHRLLMLRGMATDFLKHERIETTDVKAKEVRKIAEKVVTLGKKGGLHNRRKALAIITDESVVKKVFDDIGSRYDDRNGGYTRITKIGNRKGDGAEVSVLEFV